MAGLNPAIHVFLGNRLDKQGVDARHKAGHDEGERRTTRPMADMANGGYKIPFVYDRLSFRLYDYQCPRLDTEWLLSTLFDASLLSTSKAAGLRRLFFARASLVSPI